jgi:hypothetical protein
VDAQDYPIRHFEEMLALSKMLKALPAQVLEHHYSYQSFGSWQATIRCKGIGYRLSFDGKEGLIALERSESRKPPSLLERRALA